MEPLFIALLLLCGTVAVAGRWTAMRAHVDRFFALHAFAGMALLGLALWTWLRIGPVTLFKLVKVWPIGGITAVGAVLSGVVLGALLGLPREAPSARVRWWWPLAGALALLAGVMLVLIRNHVVKA